MIQTPIMMVAAIGMLAIGVIVTPPELPAIGVTVAAPAAVIADAAINTGDNHAGSIGSQDAGAEHSAVYGPVDQNAPLDFSTQPSSVPHTYVGGKLYNVQVLKGKSYAEVLGQMGQYATALGVSCTYCHNANNFAYDTPTKKIARTMIAMVGNVQTQYVAPIHKDYPNFAVQGAVGCITCHRGKPLMGVQNNIVPVQYLDWPAKSSRQAGVVVNSMYSVATSLGVNCQFCHNTADFVTLQYYPTNGIAHRMWRMVDDINHKYLPANVEAVTCYTCHHGAKWPNQLVATGTDQSPVQANAMHPEVHANPGAHLAAGGR
jgi:Photosynthetic reaction centre cytochrome C subunit